MNEILRKSFLKSFFNLTMHSFAKQTVLLLIINCQYLVLLITATTFVHIGMNDITEEGVYVWNDGSPVTHIRFAPSEPNNVFNEDCMTIWRGDGGFNDLSCTSLRYFICETDYGTLTYS